MADVSARQNEHVQFRQFRIGRHRRQGRLQRLERVAQRLYPVTLSGVIPQRPLTTFAATCGDGDLISSSFAKLLDGNLPAAGLADGDIGSGWRTTEVDGALSHWRLREAVRSFWCMLRLIKWARKARAKGGRQKC